MRIVKKGITLAERIDVSRIIKSTKRFSSADTVDVLSVHCPVEEVIGIIVHSAFIPGMSMIERQEIV